MPGTANVYDTQTVVAQPADDTETIVATITSVTVDANFNRVRLDGAVNVAPGTNATEVTLQWYRGALADNVTVGGAWSTEFPAASETGIVPACGTDNPPVGVYTYNLAIVVTGATAASSIDAVFATAIVGG